MFLLYYLVVIRCNAVASPAIAMMYRTISMFNGKNSKQRIALTHTDVQRKQFSSPNSSIALIDLNLAIKPHAPSDEVKAKVR